MTNRRTFVKTAGAIAGSITLASVMPPIFGKDMDFQQFLRHNVPGAMNANGSDEDFWNWVKDSFTVSNTPIDLNNGGVSPQPRVVQDMHKQYLDLCNDGPSYYMWRILDQGREPLRTKLAGLAGCSTEEIAINRNTTEAVNTVIFGMNLKQGDEVVLTKQDYPSMINAWKQREERDGIKLVWLDLQLPCEDNEVIVKQFADAFTSRTKVVHITHVINWTGQILPARDIARKAHEQGIEVLVDGAHSFAHFVFNIPDLECDYFGTSLHKWLCAPFGSGMLYIKKEKIKDIWPLLSSDSPNSDDIRKFENLGTRNIASEMAISTALDFHYTIGGERKEKRLRFLKDYWAEKALKIPGVSLQTSLKPEFSCALAIFSIKGITTSELENKLLIKYKIHTSPINWELGNIHGVRVAPSIYTSTRELDLLVNAIEQIAKG